MSILVASILKWKSRLIRRLRLRICGHTAINGPPVNKPEVLAAATIGQSTRIFGILDRVNPQLITIGSNCVIGTHAAVMTHCPIRGGLPVVIEDYVWIGFNAVILPGVTVGECSIVGASAVVTKDVPSGSIVAGNPAKILRSLGKEEESALRNRLKNRIPMG